MNPELVRDGKDGKSPSLSSSASSSSLASDESHGDLLEQLLLAADRFQLLDCVDFCVDRLAQTLTGENMAQRLAFADKYRVPALSGRCLVSFVFCISSACF